LRISNKALTIGECCFKSKAIVFTILINTINSITRTSYEIQIRTLYLSLIV
jgi:ppGpp synthetase/RelA/SpoT-type nucleotidyltranferase